MNILVFISALFSLQLFSWWVAKRTAKTIEGKEDYFLAGKTVRFWPLMMTFLATQVGGGMVLGAAEEAYKFGWPVLLYPLGASLGLILLGSGIGRKLSKLKAVTIAEIFEISYGSKVLRKIASLLSVISLFMILIAQIIASNKFLVSIGVTNPLLFIGLWTIVILYTVQGGLRAVISTDSVQAIFFSIVFFLCLGCILYTTPVASLSIPQMTNFATVSPKLWGWLLMPLLFMVIEQDMGQRCFAGSSAKVVSRASLWAGIGTMLMCCIPVFFGVLANQMGLEVAQGSSVLMATIAKLTNPSLTALLGCAVLAAIISTATSLMNAISSNLASDFSFFPRQNPIFVVKGMTCLICLAAIFFAFYFNNIVDLLIQSYELSVSCLFVPIFIALFKKQNYSLSAWVAICAGALGFILFRYYPLSLPKELASIGLSLLGYLSGESIAYYRSIKRKIKVN